MSVDYAIPSNAPSWPPRVQIAGVSSLDEAHYCRRVGVDAVGFTLELPHGLHDELTPAKAGRIAAHLPVEVLVVVITYVGTADAAANLVREVGARAIQFHGSIELSEVETFRELCPDTRTIGRVSVVDERAVNAAQDFTPRLWDALILDSVDPITHRLGATGRTHDWTVSARVVARSPLPVILAGGLNPGNVSHAIRLVKPAGVDVHTGVERPDGSRDFTAIRAFTHAALKALESSSRD